MSEEIKKNEAEVNEVELENVSGGGLCMDDYVFEKYCDRCDRRRNCGPNAPLPQAGALLRYLKTVGRPNSYRECPFYND